MCPFLDVCCVSHPTFGSPKIQQSFSFWDAHKNVQIDRKTILLVLDWVGLGWVGLGWVGLG